MTDDEYDNLRPGAWYVVDDGYHDAFTAQLVSATRPHGSGFWIAFTSTNIIEGSIEKLTMIETEPPENAKDS